MNVVISPHLDDAVFSCGDWLAAHPGAIVMTVFAGVPRDGALRTEWDTRCGFEDASQAILARRIEDREALRALGAEPAWLAFCDSQYGDTLTIEALSDCLYDALLGARADTLLFPLGLLHSDHLLVHTAVRRALPRLPGIASLAYEDAPYRAMPGVLQRRLAELMVEPTWATPAADDAVPDIAAKRRALQCYASQLRAFGPRGLEDIGRPGRLWRLQPGGTGADEDSACGR
jgi:LmbE family N-acetylglucosaminyl deacetylase